MTECGLPTVGVFAVYDDQHTEGHYTPRWVGAVHYCRFHEQPARATAQRLAERTGPSARVYPQGVDTTRPTRLACKEDRNPLQLGEILDRERIEHAGEKIRAGLAELAHLTSNGWGHSFPIGNESAVLLEFLRLSDVLDTWIGVAAVRAATRGSWTDVANTVNEAWQRHGVDGFPDTARSAWARWGGGPGDEQEPEA